MIPKHLTAAALGSLAATTAQAGAQISWINPTDGSLVIGHGTASCAEVDMGGPMGVECIDDAQLDPNTLGPGGGLKLAQRGDQYIEANLDDGSVSLVRADPTGVVKRDELVRDLRRVPKMARLRNLRTMVTATVHTVPREGSVIDGSPLTTRDVVNLHVVTYMLSGDDKRVVDEADVAWDLDTLKPALSPRALLLHASSRETVRATYYWLASWY